MYFNDKFSTQLLFFLCFALDAFFRPKISIKEQDNLIRIISPRHTPFFTSIFPPPYESKNATKVYHEGIKPIVSEYVERISAFGKVSQKFGNNLSFLQKYQLYQISTLPKFTLPLLTGQAIKCQVMNPPCHWGIQGASCRK